MEGIGQSRIYLSSCQCAVAAPSFPRARLFDALDVMLHQVGQRVVEMGDVAATGQGQGKQGHTPTSYPFDCPVVFFAVPESGNIIFEVEKNNGLNTAAWKRALDTDCLE